MDTLYSLSLLVSLLAGGAGLVLSALTAVSSRPLPWKIRHCLLVTLVGIAALAVSVSVHRFWGHGPASAEPMAGQQFLGEHTAFVVSGAVLAAGLVMVWIARYRR